MTTGTIKPPTTPGRPVSRHGTAVVSWMWVVVKAFGAATGRGLTQVGNAPVELMCFETFDADQRSLDVITFVASIHHVPLRESLHKAHQMLRPGGKLAAVGISANKTQHRRARR